MSVNTLTFEQCSTVLNSLVQQATGRASVINTEADFISVAQTALTLGKDVIFNTLSNVLARTIFAIRPYSASMKGLEKSLPQWGAYMRKFNIVASDWKDDDAYKYPVTYDATQTDPTGNGGSVDPWIINKREFIQTNFLGQSVFSDHYTIFEDQLETAFRNSEEFGQFLSMLTTDMSNKIELAKENLSRGLVSNFIGGLIAENNSSRVVHLLTEYNTVTGGSYTATSIMLPANFAPFMKWVYGRIAGIASLFKEMSTRYQTTLNSKPVPRHTPYNKQKMYMLGQDRYQIDSRVLADTFHDNYLKYADVETINFWQGIDTPDKIMVTPTYTNASGVATTGSAVTKTGVFALLFDEDAMGWAMIHEKVIPTPVNARGEYRNIWYHMRLRCFSDNTEKGVVFLLD
mgnify:CR=1 FL=1